MENGDRRFLLRPRAKGNTVAILRCVGARLPITIRRVNGEEEDEEKTSCRPDDLHRAGLRAIRECSITRPKAARSALIINKT